MFQQVTPVMLQLPAAQLCAAAYPNHPRGCPNLGKKAGCPPGAKPLGDILDLSKPVFAVYVQFDIYEHMRRMWAAHPDWTERQVRCCLYWQPRARKWLNKTIQEFNSRFDSPLTIVRCPEANGVDLSATMRTAQNPVFLEWPPTWFVNLIVLAGTRRLI